MIGSSSTGNLYHTMLVAAMLVLNNTYVRTYVHPSMHACIHAFMHDIYIYTIYIYIHNIYIYIFIFIYIYIYIYLYLYIFIYIFIYLYIYIFYGFTNSACWGLKTTGPVSAPSLSPRQGQLLRPRRHGLRLQRCHRLCAWRLQAASAKAAVQLGIKHEET